MRSIYNAIFDRVTVIYNKYIKKQRYRDRGW